MQVRDDVNVVRPKRNKQARIAKSVTKQHISICLTAWKTQDYIEECLDSIEKQTYFKDFDGYEVLLGIDGCEDTLEKVKAIQHKYRNLRVFMMDENFGTYITTNTVMSLAQYEWILRFDTDDIMMPDMIETLMSVCDGYDWVRYDMQNFLNTNNGNGDTNSLKIRSKQEAEGQTFFKKTIFEKYGGFQPWLCGADTEMYVRVRSHIRARKIDKILLQRRLHSNGLTSNEKTNMKSEIRKKYRQYIKEESPSIPIIETVTGKYHEIEFKKEKKMNEYNGQKGIITLTSWRMRINTVHVTIESLREHCKDWHIVLVLSRAEFPSDDMLPLTIQRYMTTDCGVEILWVDKDYKVFKKLLPTMEKYWRLGVPFVTADDDCLYNCDYADELYDKWKEDERNVVRYNMYNPRDDWYYTQGPSTLYPSYIYGLCLQPLWTSIKNGTFTSLQDDDTVITKILKSHGVKIPYVYRGTKFAFVFHDEVAPLHPTNRSFKPFKDLYV